MKGNCLICQSPVAESYWNSSGKGFRIPCSLCGTFTISERLAQLLCENDLSPGTHPELSKRRLKEASGAIRELHELGGEPFVEDLDVLLASVTPPVDPWEAIERILLHVHRRTEGAEAYVRLDPTTHFPIAYSRNEAEFSFLLGKTVEMGHLEQHPSGSAEYRLSMEGWTRVGTLRQQQRKSRQAFVAMWFDESLKTAFRKGIVPALDETGYRPLRIDLSEHNEKIDDRIVSEIRKSGLLVADFTGHRGGVYFEAGFAMGLGIPVIWTCRADHIGSAHFDTRQYNYIVWSNPSDLREKLRSRIEATLPLPNRPPGL